MSQEKERGEKRGEGRGKELVTKKKKNCRSKLNDKNNLW